MARREGLLDHIDFGEGRGRGAALEDGAVDVALSSTVLEEGDADLMLSEDRAGDAARWADRHHCPPDRHAVVG